MLPSNNLRDNSFGQHRRIVAALLFALLPFWLLQANPAAAVTCPGGKVLNIVAHPDDDLIFFGAREIADIKAKACVRTVYITAGNLVDTDHGYWGKREQGTVAAHAAMAGISAATIDSTMNIDGHLIATRTFVANKRVSIVFMRLLDGGQDGGAAEAITKLWKGDITRLHTVADANIDALANLTSYTKPGLTKTLFVLMSRFRPTKIRMQNYAENLGLDDDHLEHQYGAKFAYLAAKRYARVFSKNLKKLVVGYRGYQVSSYPQNIKGAALTAKIAAFRAYGVYDFNGICRNRDCASFGERGDWWGYQRWMSREYRLTDAKNQSQFFEIRGFGDKCIDVENGFIEDGTPIQIWTCENVIQQKWRFDRDPLSTDDSYKFGTLTDQNSGKCMAQVGSSVQLAACSADSSQVWTFAGDGEIVSATGKCLNVPSATADVGTDLSVDDCVYSSQQLWGYGRSAAAAPAAHQLVITGGGCLTAESVSFAATGAVTVEACSGAAAQQWRFSPTFYLRGLDGKCASASGPADGSAVVVKPCNLLQARANSDGWEAWNGTPAIPTVRLHSFDSTAGTKCAGVRGQATANGTVVEISECVVGDAQEWQTTPAFISPAP